MEALSAKAEAAAEEEKRHQDRLQELRSKAAEGARVLTTVMVDVTSPEGGGTRANLTIREGEPLDVTVQRFAAAHGIGQQGVQTLIAEAKRKVCRSRNDSLKRCLGVKLRMHVLSESSAF